MKNADSLKDRFGANMRESMGAARPAPAAPPQTVFHGGTGQYEGCSRVKDAFAIEVGRLAPDPDQPRKEFDRGELESLAASLKERGQLQPIRVRWDQGVEHWFIIAGERRYRAALMAGLPTILCIEARGTLTPADILEDQLVENCLRSDLKPVEQAHAFQVLMRDRGWSQRQLAEHLHMGLASVNRALALLELPESVQAQVEQGSLAPSVAYEVSRLNDPAAQVEVAARIVSEHLNRDEAIKEVRQKTARPIGKGRDAGPRGSKGRGGAFKLRVDGNLVVSVARLRGKAPLGDADIEGALLSALASIRGRAEDSAAA